ncbi:MAG: hypothetical protein ABIV05_05585 [Actinomycetota bacterium]
MRPVPLLLLTCLLGPVGGCAAASGTVTPSRTVTVTTTPAAPRTPTAAPASSDVVGRAHDVGTVRRTGTVGGGQVVELDRYTLDGTSDDALAADGVPLTPHANDLFSNQNDQRTYTIPVAPGATVVLNECVTADGALGLRSTPVPDTTAWLRDVDPDTVVLVTIDGRGRATRFDTDPRCR